MNIYLELFGYLGTLIVLISMLMTSILKLRIFNIIGSVISMIYSFICGAYPVVFLNLGLIVINAVQLIRSTKEKHVFNYISVNENDACLAHFIEYYSQDLKFFFPEWRHEILQNSEIYLIYTKAEPVGLFIGRRENNTMHIDIDYAVPKLRDNSLAKFLYKELSKDGITRFIAGKSTVSLHHKYLLRMGFKEQGDTMVKPAA